MKSLRPIEIQTKIACKFITNLSRRKPDEIKRGFYIIGFSQGGIIARNLVHTCSIVQKFLKRLILSGTPNMGVNKVPSLKTAKSYDNGYVKKSFIDILTDRDNWYFPWKNKNKKWSSKVSSLQILNLKKKGPIIQFFEKDVFGPEKFKKLNFVLNLIWNKDEIVIPISSCGFGADVNGEEMNSFKNTKYFKMNKFGFRDMYLSGRFANCLLDGEHDDVNDDNNFLILDYLNDDCKFNKEVFQKYSRMHLYQFCLYKKISDMNIGKTQKVCLHLDPNYNEILNSSYFFKKLSGPNRNQIKKELI